MNQVHLFPSLEVKPLILLAGKKSQANASTKQNVIDAAQLKVQAILARFPLYPELDLAALRELTK